MDPLSAIGGIQATGAIVAVIVQTLKNLSDARSRFQNAETALRLLISELTALKAAVLRIEDWARYNFVELEAEHDLNEAFKVSFDGCTIAMEILSKEVDGLRSKNPFLMKAKMAWTETGIKEHADRFRSQVAALNLLIQAVHCHNATQQARLLEDPSNRRIIQKVADDTSTLRASRAYTEIGSTALSVISHEDSTISSATFDVDRELVNTNPYRKAKAHQESKLQESPRQNSPNRNPFLNRSMSDSTFRIESVEPAPPPTAAPTEQSRGDSGFYDEDADIVNPTAYREAMAATGSATKPNVQRSVSAPLGKQPQPQKFEEERDQLTPMERFQAEWDRPQRYSPNPIESHLSVRPIHQPSRSDSSLTLQPSGDQSHVRRSPGGTIKRIISKTGLGKPGSGSSLSPASPEGMRKNPKSVRRKVEMNVHQSIDFGSEDGLSAPTIVRAAQSASRVEIERLIEHRADVEAKHEGTGRTALAVASHCGNDGIVSLLLHHRAQVDVKDTTGMAPLHLAASRGHYRVVQYLLEDHADVDSRGPDNKTPLRFACDNGHFDCCELLLHYRAKVNARDTHMVTALHAAAKIGDLEIVELLLKNGADLEAKDGNLMNALHYATEGDFDTVVQTLLSHKADIESRGFQGRTPLCSACASGSFQTASLLISRKANIKHRADKGLMPLHFACLHDRADTAELLLQQKRLPIDAKDDDGRTPLHLAVKSNSFSTAELLIRRGANIEAMCNRTLRPLHYACDNGDQTMVSLLLGSHVQLEAPSQLGWRAIHFAASSGSASVLDALLRQGAQIDPFTHLGERPISMASTNGHILAVRLLIDRGSAMRLRVNRGSSLEDSPFCRAARAGHVDVCEEFLRRGVSVLQRDEDNWQPLRCAAYNGHVDVVKLLLVSGAAVGKFDAGQSADSMKNVSSFGWAADVDPARKWAIANLLREAEERERSAPTRVGEDDPFLTVLSPTAGSGRGETMRIYEVG